MCEKKNEVGKGTRNRQKKKKMTIEKKKKKKKKTVDRKMRR